jgi:hypothetical protein
MTSSSTSLQQTFEQFEKESVRVPDSENRAAKKVHPEFRDAVKEYLAELFADSFLAGSYARKTQAVHLKDLDVIVVLHDPTGELRASASGTLAAMKKAANSYGPVSGVTTKCRAVECHLGGYTFWVDLVPALDDGYGGLLLAFVDQDENIDEWCPADPKGQLKACRDKNADTGGAYVAVTRICKFRNGSFTSSPSQQKPLPSYLVEAILYDALTGAIDWADAVLAFFRRAKHHLSIASPSVPCPGKSTDYVDEMLDDERRLKALVKVEAALANAEAAAAATSPDDAREAWAKVFGPSFPAPSNSSRAIANALRGGTAGVTGTSVTVGSGRKPIPARSHGPARP